MLLQGSTLVKPNREGKAEALDLPRSFKKQDSGVFMATGPHRAMQESRKENGG